MKTRKFNGIDYEFRPQSYQEVADPLETILLNIKGTNRRKMVRDYWNAGRLEELGEQYLRGSLDDEQRRRLGRIHPSFMGGEYLPDPSANEMEIVELADFCLDFLVNK
jgi:hypothetical protein